MKALQKNVSLFFSGLAVGAVNGLFGGGGGMLAVPVLRVVGKKSAIKAHATAILVILPICAVSSVVYLSSGFFETELFVSVSLGVLFGGMLGAKLLNRISSTAATLIFAAVMLAAGIRMFF